jgi:hypothetical protein
VINPIKAELARPLLRLCVRTLRTHPQALFYIFAVISLVLGIYLTYGGFTRLPGTKPWIRSTSEEAK